MEIDGGTKMAGVLGVGIDYTLSPLIHNKGYSLMDMNAVYLPFQGKEGYLHEILSGFCFLDNFMGFNVTVPFKEMAYKEMDICGEEADAVRAVNTVKPKQDKLIGYNTDVVGLKRAVEELGFKGSSRNALVLGAGGASRAAAVALDSMGVETIHMANRGKVRLDRAVNILKGRVDPLEWNADSIARVLKGIGVVVNGTTVGSNGKDIPPVRLEMLPEDVVIYDMVYAPGDTPLVRKAKKLGLTAANGLTMLLHQALTSFEIFTGARPPIEPIREMLLKTGA
jgi:shikimate dehydrogenase